MDPSLKPSPDGGEVFGPPDNDLIHVLLNEGQPPGYVLHNPRSGELNITFPPGVNLWYLSFVDTDISNTIPLDQQKPGGPSWLGACIVPGTDIYNAAQSAHQMGCNPGGEVRGWEFLPNVQVPARFIFTLMDHNLVDEFDRWGETCIEALMPLSHNGWEDSPCQSDAKDTLRALGVTDDEL